jgi:hypothetical protein
MPATKDTHQDESEEVLLTPGTPLELAARNAVAIREETERIKAGRKEASD